MCLFAFSFLSYRLHVKGFNESVKLIGFLSLSVRIDVGYV